MGSYHRKGVSGLLGLTVEVHRVMARPTTFEHTDLRGALLDTDIMDTTAE